jgi:membrane-bound ClpP family serine protease
VREWILAMLQEPAVAAGALALGLAGIIAEFLLPARVLPATVGGVLAVLGLWALWPEHWRWAVGVMLPFVGAAVVLLKIAWRARRNKLNQN